MSKQPALSGSAKRIRPFGRFLYLYCNMLLPYLVELMKRNWPTHREWRLDRRQGLVNIMVKHYSIESSGV